MSTQEDKVNTLGIVTIGLASTLLLWASVVALQAYYANTFGEEQRAKRAAGEGAELRTARAAQRATLDDLTRNGDGTLTIPIDRSKDLVIESLRTGAPESLVPAVGPHDTPTVPAEWGRPPDDAQVPADGAGAEGASGASGDQAAAGGADGSNPDTGSEAGADAEQDTAAGGSGGAAQGEANGGGAAAGARDEPADRSGGSGDTGGDVD